MTVLREGGRPGYAGSERNGVRSWEYGSWTGSFRFAATAAQAPPLPPRGSGAAAAGKPPPAPSPAGRAAPVEAAGGALRVGEYACYGSGGRIMAGLGFRVLPGGRYTDLDGGNAGTYAISGGSVQLQGGHLGGQAGRNLCDGSFQIGAMAGCEPF